MVSFCARPVRGVLTPQRTANFSVPARDVPLTPEDSREIKANYAKARELANKAASM